MVRSAVTVLPSLNGADRLILATQPQPQGSVHGGTVVTSLVQSALINNFVITTNYYMNRGRERELVMGSEFRANEHKGSEEHGASDRKPQLKHQECTELAAPWNKDFAKDLRIALAVSGTAANISDKNLPILEIADHQTQKSTRIGAIHSSGALAGDNPSVLAPTDAPWNLKPTQLEEPQSKPMWGFNEQLDKQVGETCLKDGSKIITRKLPDERANGFSIPGEFERVAFAKDNGKETYTIRMKSDGTKTYFQEGKDGPEWTSKDGINWKSSGPPPMEWQGSVTVKDGCLIREWKNPQSQSSTLHPDGTKDTNLSLVTPSKGSGASIEHAHVHEEPQKDGGKKVEVSDNNNQPSYTVSYGPDGKVTSFQETGGPKWTRQRDGSFASDEKEPNTWRGAVEIDGDHNLVTISENGSKHIRDPFDNLRADILPDKSRVERFTDPKNGQTEVAAYNARGKQTYNVTLDQDGTVIKCGDWESKDGLNWTKNGNPKYNWKGTIALDENGNLKITESTHSREAVVQRPDGGKEFLGAGNEKDQLTYWSVKISYDPENAKVTHNVDISLAPDTRNPQQQSKTHLEAIHTAQENKSTIESGEFRNSKGDVVGCIKRNRDGQLEYKHPDASNTSETNREMWNRVPLKSATVSESDGVITLKTEDGTTIKLSPDGSIVETKQIQGQERTIFMKDANGNSFEYEWDKNGNLDVPKTVYIQGPATNNARWQFDHAPSGGHTHYNFQVNSRTMPSTTSVGASISAGFAGVSVGASYSDYLADGAALNVWPNGALALEFDAQTVTERFKHPSVVVFNPDGTQTIGTIKPVWSGPSTHGRTSGQRSGRYVRAIHNSTLVYKNGITERR